MLFVVLKAIFANLLVILSIAGYSVWIPRYLPDSFSRATKVLCSVVGGYGTLGTLLFLVGQISYTPFSIGIVLFFGIALALFKLRAPRQFHLHLKELFPNKTAAALLLFLIVLTTVAGLAQPVGDWGVDGVAYHYVGPKVWLREGIIRPIPDNAPTSYAFLAEMIFGPLRVFGGERAQSLSAAWTFPLLLAIAASIGKRCGLNPREAWWLAALIAAMGALYEGSHSGFIDAVYAAFLLAAIRVGFDAAGKKHFVLFGFFCGLALASKYLAIAAVPMLILCAVWGKESAARSSWIRNAAIAAAIAAIAGSPVYLRNWILLGSPIYPAPPSLTNFLHVKYYTAAGLKYFYNYAAYLGEGMGHSLSAFLLLPYNLTYHTSNFHGAGGIGLAPLAFGWLGVLGYWRESFARRLSVAAFFLLLFWFVTLQDSRYLIHFYAISAILGVLGWKYAKSILGQRGKWICAAIVAVSLVYGVALEAKSRIPDLHAVFSPAYQQHRRETEIPYYESFEFLNHDVSVTRVLFLDESIPAYYSDKAYIKPLGQWKEQLFPDASTPMQVLTKLGELRPSHILDVESRVSGFNIPKEFPGLVLVFERPGQRIYEVTHP